MTEEINRVICPECGNQASDTAGFCESCGADLSAGDAGEESPRTVLVGESDEGKKGSSETVIVSSREELPTAFGRYRVLREVGRGAMGIVYLARDDKISRNVAIKTLHLDPKLP
ncbi:MAG: zinc-ribbon domain-containing protein, partial [Actinobacteria bacterium]|nr:zinc-ribbon domain-containing protein [Actinomycetota bacterium]